MIGATVAATRTSAARAPGACSGYAANSCTNQNPGYDCTCGTGFSLINNETSTENCSDVNECNTTYGGVIAGRRCNQHVGYGSCGNTTGAYTCSCNTGYTTSGSGHTLTCGDVDECSVWYGGINPATRCNENLGYGAVTTRRARTAARATPAT
ncbi:MAG: hypothetical protein H6720_16810 [Sandaracinus sp.]|nr:hypothetical protein [Sandaracinus sp.]